MPVAGVGTPTAAGIGPSADRCFMPWGIGCQTGNNDHVIVEVDFSCEEYSSRITFREGSGVIRNQYKLIYYSTNTLIS